jgi:hypothetical protein
MADVTRLADHLDPFFHTGAADREAVLAAVVDARLEIGQTLPRLPNAGRRRDHVRRARQAGHRRRSTSPARRSARSWRASSPGTDRTGASGHWNAEAVDGAYRAECL